MDEIEEALAPFKRAVHLTMELEYGDPSPEPRTIPLSTYAESRQEAESNIARYIDDFAKHGIKATVDYQGEEDENIHRVDVVVKGRIGE